MSPGPSLLIVSHQTISFGLKNGIIFSFAHGIGIFLYAFVTAIGIGLLVIKSPILYNGTQIVGIVFLIYLSFQMLTFKMENPVLKNKTEINNAITNSICPTALTGATAFAENA